MDTFTSPTIPTPPTPEQLLADSTPHDRSQDSLVPFDIDYQPFGIRQSPLIFNILSVRGDKVIDKIGGRIDDYIEQQRVENNLSDSKASFQEILSGLMDKLCLSENSDPLYIISKIDSFINLKNKKIASEEKANKKRKQLEEIAKQKRDKEIKEQKAREKSFEENKNRAREILKKQQEEIKNEINKKFETVKNKDEFYYEDIFNDLIETKRNALKAYRFN